MSTLVQNAYKHNISASWSPGSQAPRKGQEALKNALRNVAQPLCLVRHGEKLAVAPGGRLYVGPTSHKAVDAYPVQAWVPALPPQQLGSSEVKKLLGIRHGYIVGAMANGITSAEMVEKMGRAGMLAIFGSAGLSLPEIEAAIDRLQQLRDVPWGLNLIHSPSNHRLEEAVVNLCIKRGVFLVSASAFLGLTPPLVYCRVKGISRGTNGQVTVPRTLIAKVSRVEVARKFLSPPPEKILRELVSHFLIDEEEARLAASIPMADCITAEADSGGHTDNRPALTLLPTLMALRDELEERFGYRQHVEIGLGGGIATPHAAAAAFAMGAAYILAGSIHQACLEAGTSEAVRRMLSEARQADIAMSPSADMFEMGVKVQVLKRGTMFPLRAARLYDLYTAFDRWEDIPAKQRDMVEKEILQCSFEDAWRQTRAFFQDREPAQIQAALNQPKHRLALVFRSYLGKASGWAIDGDPGRRIDYQVWCGPAMGAFNQWVQGSFLENPRNRDTVTVAMNLMFGAAVLTRANWARFQGAVLPRGSDVYRPLELNAIERWISL